MRAIRHRMVCWQPSWLNAGLVHPRALDGRYGFLALYAKSPRPDALSVKADVPLQIHSISIKPYSCCRLFHSLIDGLREVSGGFKLPYEATHWLTGRTVSMPTVLTGWGLRASTRSKAGPTQQSRRSSPRTWGRPSPSRCATARCEPHE